MLVDGQAANYGAQADWPGAVLPWADVRFFPNVATVAKGSCLTKCCLGNSGNGGVFAVRAVTVIKFGPHDSRRTVCGCKARSSCFTRRVTLFCVAGDFVPFWCVFCVFCAIPFQGFQKTFYCRGRRYRTLDVRSLIGMDRFPMRIALAASCILKWWQRAHEASIL